MNPWNVLGWLLIASIVVPIALMLAAGTVGVSATALKEAKEARKRSNAERGRLACEYRDCTNIATRRGASGYACEKHIGTYLTRRGAVSYALGLKHTQDGPR